MNWRKLYDKRSTSPTASQNNFQRTRLADDQVHTLPPRPTLTKPLFDTESDTKNIDSRASSAHIRHDFRSRHLPPLADQAIPRALERALERRRLCRSEN
jgi:hypothetical protein